MPPACERRRAVWAIEAQDLGETLEWIEKYVTVSDSVVALVEPHPAIRNIGLVGSRSDGSANAFSDWDFRVEVNDFATAGEALPDLLAPLEPLAQQWDRLSDEWCWMLIIRGPTKIDLIFADQVHLHEPPWQPDGRNLKDVDAHFWDWLLWLRSKYASNKDELIARELDKLFHHLLGPLGVKHPPSSIASAVTSYRAARNRLERQFGIVIRRDLDVAAAPVFEDLLPRRA